MARNPDRHPTNRPPTASGNMRYERARDLPKLVALWPAEVSDSSEAGRLRLLARLRSALRRERQRGLAGHWCYDLKRHVQLLAAYRSEAADLLNVIGNARQPADRKNDGATQRPFGRGSAG